MLLRQARLAPGADPADLRIHDGRVGGSAGDDGAGEVVDLGGRLVLPGLWDSHVHFDQWALSQAALDLSGARSAAEVVALFATRLEEPEPDVVVAHGFRDGLWPDEPNAALLDAIAPHRPLVAVSADLHSAWLNTAALQHFSLAPHPTGLLREAEFMPLMNELQRVDPDVLDRWVDEAARAVAARGVVGIVDFEIADNITAWSRRITAGTDRLRVRCGIWPQWLDATIDAGWRTGDEIPGTGGLATVGPMKVIVDGSLGTRTAYCHDPYPDGDHGVLTVPPDELARWMTRARDHGIDSAIHAIGDRACEHVLDCFETTGTRGSVEHAQLVADADFARFAQLGVTASIQPAHVHDDAELADRYWAGRTARAFPYGTLLGSGATLSLGSDAPVARLDPWLTLAAAVDRTLPDGRVWHREHELPWPVALAASTGGRERVTAGDVADLVVLNADALPATGAALAETRCGARCSAAAGPTGLSARTEPPRRYPDRVSDESPQVFRLAYVPGVTPAKWVRVWTERMPDIPIELVPVPSTSGAACVREDQADAALLRLPLERDGLSVISLYTEVSVVVVPAEHAIAAVEEVSVADLEEETVLHPLDDVLDWAKLPGEEAFERPETTEGAISHVASEVGVLVTPQSLARLHHRKDLTYRPVVDAPQSQVGLVWLTDRTTDLVDEFVGIVRGRTANSSRGRQDEPDKKAKRRGERQGSQPRKVVGDKKPKTRRGNAGRPKSAGRVRKRRG